MESYIQITWLNDFVFCPRSLYFHNLYGQYSTDVFHDTPQKKGNIAHESIDTKTYSTSKKWLQGLEIWSDTLGVCGKIDLFNTKTGELVERKRKITTVYDGYKYQVWAQAMCLAEEGFSVQKIVLHSLSTNTRFEIPLPGEEEKNILKNVVKDLRHFSFETPFIPNPQKCAHCIYAELCDAKAEF